MAARRASRPPRADRFVWAEWRWPMKVPLDALLRRASRMAEQMFDKTGEVDMLWLVDTPDDGISVIVSPIVGRDAAEGTKSKDNVADAMREFFREHRVTRYARAMEAWTAIPVRSSADLPDDEGTVFVT